MVVAEQNVQLWEAVVVPVSVHLYAEEAMLGPGLGQLLAVLVELMKLAAVNFAELVVPETMQNVTRVVLAHLRAAT